MSHAWPERAARRLGNAARRRQRHSGIRLRRYAKVVGRAGERLSAGVRQFSRAWSRVLRHLDRYASKASRPFRRALKRRSRWQEQVVWHQQERRIERDVERAVAGDDPVILGPWLSEVGFEVLYWIPFLRWVKAAYGLEPGRAIVVSRGGVAPWYQDVSDRYIELFDLYSPSEFAVRNAERGEVKQYAMSQLDHDVVAQVRRRCDAPNARVLHPSMMYLLFRQFWSGHRGLGMIDAHTRYDPSLPLAREPGDGLPGEYVAVKFYTAQSLPKTAAVEHQVRRLVRELAETNDVVLLNTGLRIDDHDDFLVEVSERVTTNRDRFEARRNLIAQSRVIAGASRFVGTCGGLAWLAPMLGIPTTAVFADSEFLHAHLGLALRTYERMGAASFAPVDLRGLPATGTVPSGGAASFEKRPGGTRSEGARAD